MNVSRCIPLPAHIPNENYAVLGGLLGGVALLALYVLLLWSLRRCTVMSSSPAASVKSCDAEDDRSDGDIADHRQREQPGGAAEAAGGGHANNRGSNMMRPSLFPRLGRGGGKAGPVDDHYGAMDSGEQPQETPQSRRNAAASSDAAEEDVDVDVDADDAATPPPPTPPPFTALTSDQQQQQQQRDGTDEPAHKEEREGKIPRRYTRGVGIALTNAAPTMVGGESPPPIPPPRR